MSARKLSDFHIAEPETRPSSSDLWFFSYLPWSLYNGLSTPLIPLLAIALYNADSPLIIALIVAASTLTEVPFTIFWGNVSDRIRHRKYFVVLSFIATGFVLFVMPFAPNLTDYLSLNILEGVCSAASTPIGTVLLLETRRKHWWARDVGLFGLVSGIGSVAGLALGGLFLAGFSTSSRLSFGLVGAMQFLLLLSGVLAILSGVLAYFWIEEPQDLIDRNSVDLGDQFHRGMVERIRGFRKRILHVVDLARGEAIPLTMVEVLLFLSLLLVSFGSQTFYGTFIYFLTASTGAGLGEDMVFFVFLASAAASTALFYHSGVAVEKYSPKWVFVETLVARAALIPLFLLAGMWLTGHPRSMAITMIGLNAAMGLLWAFSSTASTLFLLRLLKGPSNKGKALGIYNAVVGFGGLVGTIFGGWLYNTSDSYTAYLVATAIIIVGGLIIIPIPLRMVPYPHKHMPVKGASPVPKPVKPPLKQWRS
ncbi:MAG: MFS transporter [Nitrososphaerota archaeon]|nr:MFS transporter [Nitrososphaerota archaeon]